MSNDLLEKRNERTRQRKSRKQRIDSLISLSREDEAKNVRTLSANVAMITDTNQTARLLDEGYCDNGFVLKKGAIEKFLNGGNEYVTGWEMADGTWQRTEVLNLTDDFVGTVNLGHKDFATDPFILGEFRKSDFTLVDIENDRKALNVNVRLDEDSMFVKELRRQPYDIGVSAEFYYHVDWTATEQLEAEYGIWVPVIDEIFIFAYGLVGECGNVNSSGLELKGGNMPENIENNAVVTEEQTAETADTQSAEVTEVTEITEITEGTEPETAENAEGNAQTDETVTDEAGEGEEGNGEEGSEEEAIVNQLRTQVESLRSRIEELEQANAVLKKTNRKLSGKYQKELEKKEKFKNDLKGLTVELLPDEDKKEDKASESAVIDRNYLHGDGIGEI